MRFATCHLQITIELRTEELLKQDCAKPLQCVLHSSTCKSQCNYVIQLPNTHLPKADFDAEAEKSRFSIDFYKEFYKENPSRQNCENRRFLRDFLHICTLQLQNTIRRTVQALKEGLHEAITMRFATCHLQITIELRAEELLKQDCAKPLQCVLHSSTCKSQCNYVFQLPKHISQNRISTPRQKNHDFLSTFKRNFIRKMQAAKIVKTKLFTRLPSNLHAAAAKHNKENRPSSQRKPCAKPLQCVLRHVTCQSQ